jgi:exopolysaccharide biosynthesis polyprenyl glycosylphosphotransferase
LVFLLVDQALRRLSGVHVFTAGEALVFIGSALITLPVSRAWLRSYVLPTIMRPRRALIVGAGSAGRLIERKITGYPGYGLECIGFVDDRASAGGEIKLLGTMSELPLIVREQEIDWVILAFSRTPYEQTIDVIRGLRRLNVRLSILPRYFELFAANATIDDFSGTPIVNLPPIRLSRSGLAVKRCFDLLVSALALVLLAPLMGAIALAIKLDSRGPVLFRQWRLGQGESTFRIVKFRTMVEGAESQRDALLCENDLNGPLFKLRADPRVTRVGSVLRRTSLDELPQLFNVIRGEMSLVGPRPFVIDEARQITGWAGRRVDIRPGITGVWQVLGRNDIPFDEMVQLDYVYVTNWSLWWDFKLLCQTIPTVLSRRGAY